MAQRGSGSRSSRQFIEDLEMLGVDGSASVSNAHTSFSGAMPAENLLETLAIYADVVRSAAPGRGGIRGQPAGLPAGSPGARGRSRPEGDARAAPPALSRSLRPVQSGNGRVAREDLAGATCSSSSRTLYRPTGAILGVAGQVGLGPRCGTTSRRCWAIGRRRPTGDREKPASGGYHHLPHASSQTHIGVAYPCVPYSHADYFQARGAVGILSDGMSSRLFTEVREKRGLCYSVYASCHSLRDRGSVVCYAGTTTERAQETLDVLLQELTRLAQGVSRTNSIGSKPASRAC